MVPFWIKTTANDIFFTYRGGSVLLTKGGVGWVEESLKCWCLGAGSLLPLGVSSVGKGTIQHPGPTTASQPIFQAQWERVRCEDSEARAECGGVSEGYQRHS